MKHLISLLAFSLLIGCDGEKSNLAPSKDSPEGAATETPSKDSLGEQQKVTEEAMNTSLPPIPDPMDAKAIMKLWSMDHNPTGFIEEMKLPGRPGTWDGVASSGPVRNDWVQSEKFSVDEKWVGRRFTVAKFSHESNENHYSVFTYLPDEDSFIMWIMNNNGITQSKGERLEEGGIRWRSTILPKSDESFFTSINAKVTFANDGFEANESVKLLNEEKVVWFTDVKYHWTGFPGMKPLGKKEILELAKLPHKPDLKDPEMKWMLPKAGIWEFKDTISTRDSEQEEEFTYGNVTKRVDESHTVFTTFKDEEILNIGIAVPNPNKETEEILRVLYFPKNDELVWGISFLDKQTGTDTFKSLRRRSSEDSVSVEAERKPQSKRGSSNFASNFRGVVKFRDDGKLRQIVKFEGEWVKELPAEGEELSNEWLEKKLAEIDSLEEAEEEVYAPPPNQANNNTAAKTRNRAKKLTPKQVEEILAYEIGRWETTGQGTPTGGEPQVIENTMDVRWKEQGKSLEYEFSLMQNGKKVTYLGHKKYDHSQSIFIVHLKWGDNPETVTHEVYDPYTRTYQGQSAPTSPPSRHTSMNVMQRASNDKLLNTLKVFEDGQLVYVQQLVSLRQPANTEPANTKPATPDDAITAIKNLGGKVTVDENNDAIKVRLGYSKITDAGLKHLKELTELKELYLNNTDITDAGLVHLKGLANLELLIIRKTKITDAGVVHLNGLTKLQGLGFTRTNITDAALVHVESLTNLERLWLTDTRITDAGLLHLKGLTNLQGLNLSNTKVSDAGLVHLKAMTRLQGLGLWGTKMTDAGLVHLEGLAKLETLGLKNTQVSDAAIKKFQQALPNCKVER